MTDSQLSVINFGELSKPATILIEKISNAVGDVFEPYQIKRIARAETEAEKIKTLAQIELEELQYRALQRFIQEETIKQKNFENITLQAINDIDKEASPEKIDNDWIAHFFDKCKIVSDKEMQVIWSKILSGQANKPGTYSKRTIDLLASLDKNDAENFTRLCSFAWYWGKIDILIYDLKDAIYEKNDIKFDLLTHFENIGLINFNSLTGYNRQNFPTNFRFYYYGIPVNVQFTEEKRVLQIGKVLLTQVGQEIAHICGSKPNMEFYEYILSKWVNMGLILYSDWPKIKK